MLYFARWKIVADPARRAGRASSPWCPISSPRRPSTAGRAGCRSKQIVLGLDLQGGAYLLYEVDRTTTSRSGCARWSATSARRCSRAPRIGYTGLGIQGDGVQLRIRDPAQLDVARERLEKLRNPLSTSLLGGAGGQRVRPHRRRRRAVRRLDYSADGPRAAGARHRRSSRSRSSSGASTNSAPPSRASSARATTASWSRRPASAIRSG